MANIDSDRENDASSEEEEDWMDTNWDTIQEGGSSRIPQSRKNDVNPGVEQSSEGNAPLMTRMQLNDHKAGMQGLDKDHINQIIYEASKGSRFFENERRKEDQVKQKIQEQERHRRAITETELVNGTLEADRLITELNLSRDLTQTIVHVDMDAFYAAVEMRDDPSLRNKPMAVGGIGMLSTSNYEARKYGVRAAMPGFIGKKLCPQLAIVPANFSKYREVSGKVRQIFADYDASFCPMSLDEAYLNFAQHVTKRQTMGITDRSFLKRCQTPANPALCCCDLNVTIRDSVLKHGRSEKSSNSVTNHVEDGDDSNENATKLTPETSPSKNDAASLVQTVVGLHGGVTSTNASSQKTDGSVQASYTKLDDGGSMVSKEQCPSCGKVVPPYDIVTFDVDVESAVHEMRCRIEQRTCLTASAGIAPNMMLSKVCSDQNKPNGQFFLPAIYENIMQFVQKLPIRKISGIGSVTEQLLGVLGISTCRDLFDKRGLLYHLYSSVSFSYFMRVTCGLGSTQVARASEEERKSMSTEQTFGEMSQPEELYSKCLELCQCLAEDLAKEQLTGKTVSLKLKTTDFQVRTRAQTISNYTSDAEVIFTVAKGILRNEILAESPKLLRLRLMGVRMSKLIAGNECPQEKQNTIVGFFKKASAPCQTDRLKPSTAACSSEKIHNSSVSTSVDGSSVNAHGMKMLPGSGSVESNLREDTQISVSVTEGTTTYILGEKVNVPDTGTGPGDQVINMGDKDSHTPDTYLLGACRQQERDTVTNLEIRSNADSVIESEKDSKESEHSTGSHRFSQVQADNCFPEMTQVQNQISKSSFNSESESPASAEVLVHVPSVSHSPVRARHGGSSSSRGCDWDDEASTSNTDSVLRDAVVHSSSTVREPFTCPVCSKPVGCINLTDFNAHIDKCLQLDPQPSSSTSQTSAPAFKKECLPQTTSQRPQTSQSKVNRGSSGVKSTNGKKQRQFDGKPGRTSSVSVSSDHTTAVPHNMAETSPYMESCDVEKSVVGSSRPKQQESSHQSEAASADYLVCPLCGAERADWTLDTFNQHVDACLNRGTISQILREQRNSELPLRKRPAASHQEQQRTSQQGKKAKRNQSPRSERSILSFFKT